MTEQPDSIRPAGVAQFVVDRVRVNTLLRRRGASDRVAGGGEAWVTQAPEDRGKLPDDPGRFAPPLLLSLWTASTFHPQYDDPLPEVPTLLELTRSLAPPAWFCELVHCPVSLAAYLDERQEIDGYQHEGFQVQLWLDPMHLPSRPRRAGPNGPVWPTVCLLNVSGPARWPEDDMGRTERLVARLEPLLDQPHGDLSHRAAPPTATAVHKPQRVVAEQVVIRLTTFQPPLPGRFESLAEFAY